MRFLPLAPLSFPLASLHLFACLLAAQPAAQSSSESVPAEAQAEAAGRGDWQSQAAGNVRAGEYHFAPIEADVWSAPNRSQGLRSRVHPAGLEVFPRETGASGHGADWKIELRTGFFGRVGDLHPIADGVPSTVGNRAELDHGELLEWFVNEEGGIEQGWTIEDRPRGLAPLVIGLVVDGDVSLRVDADGRSGSFVDDTGRAVANYRKLVAWDATGRELEARMVPVLSGVQLFVDDSAATYPVTVDPLLTNHSWTDEGDQPGASFGWSVSSAGDVNADGFDDVIVGAPLHDNGQVDEGRAFVYHGSVTGLGATPAWSAETNNQDSELGHSVACAGDVNGDGYSDVIIGALGSNSAFVYHGSAAGLALTHAWQKGGQGDFGFSVSSAGDVNGDGYSDVIVGSPEYNGSFSNNNGRADVFLGSSSGLSTTAAWTIEFGQGNSAFGYSVASAGDVNGDGFGDVIVGARIYSNGESFEGGAFVYHGSAAGLGLTPSWTGESNQMTSSYGWSVSGAGDVNGDGFSDVIVGAHNYTNGEFFEGRAYVYHGSAAGLSPTEAWTAESNGLLAQFGCSVDTAGDVSGDGYSDVIVGAYFFDNGTGIGREGRAFVYHGSATGLSLSDDWTAASSHMEAAYGWSVATAGDVNGDGYSDVIVGAYSEDDGTDVDEGQAWVFHGSANPCTSPGAQAVSRNAGTNPHSYLANPPVPGTIWSASVDLTTTGHTHAQVLGFTAATEVPFATGQTLLVTGAKVMTLPLQPGPLASWSFLVPSDVSFCGASMFTQAAHLFGVTPYALSNAQDLVVGF